MKIIYNPKEGADISNVNVGGSKLEPHAKDTLKQYPDSQADSLMDTFPFLEVLTAEEAQDVINRQKKEAEEAKTEEEFPCRFCEVTSKTKAGIGAHERNKHKKEIEAEGKPAIDPDLVPVAGSTKVDARPVAKKEGQDQVTPTEDLPNGTDKDGTEWYGEGLTEEKQSFAPKGVEGQNGNFGG